jgi:8-oxo-dGTP diphosphatase
MLTCTFEDNQTAHLRHVTVDALIERDGQILLVKRNPRYFIEPGKYALPGGYLERDESAQEAVVREVQEETGFESAVVSLFRVIDRPRLIGDDRQNVGFFFHLQVMNQTTKPDYEIKSLHWLSLNHLPAANLIGFDHLETIKIFVKFLSQPFPLPIFNDDWLKT